MKVNTFGSSIATVEQILEKLKKGKAAPKEILEMTKTANGEIKLCMEKLRSLEEELNRWVEKSL